MPAFSLTWRYNGQPDEHLYGLKAQLNRKEEKTLSSIAGMSRETCQLVVDIARSSWSIDSPASAGAPPGRERGNLDTSANIYERDLSGRFASSGKATASTIIWDTRTGSNYHGRGEYAGVQEYGLDGLLFAHPFLGPALDKVEKGFLRKMLETLK